MRSSLICKLTLHMVGCWLVVLRIYVALAVFQPYRDLEAGDNQSLKFKWRCGESNPGPLAPQAKSLTTRPPPLHVHCTYVYDIIMWSFKATLPKKPPQHSLNIYSVQWTIYITFFTLKFAYLCRCGDLNVLSHLLDLSRRLRLPWMNEYCIKSKATQIFPSVST